MSAVDTEDTMVRNTHAQYNMECRGHAFHCYACCENQCSSGSKWAKQSESDRELLTNSPLVRQRKCSEHWNIRTCPAHRPDLYAATWTNTICMRTRIVDVSHKVIKYIHIVVNIIATPVLLCVILLPSSFHSWQTIYIYLHRLLRSRPVRKIRIPELVVRCEWCTYHVHHARQWLFFPIVLVIDVTFCTATTQTEFRLLRRWFCKTCEHMFSVTVHHECVRIV